jgi:long-subunit acyl-CoA synthetase (AMP-forming)/acyl carrier protein
MIKEEKINRRKALSRVFGNLKLLEESNMTIKDIFYISFSRDNFTMFNVLHGGGYKNYTYGNVKKNIHKCANYFYSCNHINKYVGLLMDNSPLWVSCFYGLLESGHIPVLLSTKNSVEDIMFVCDSLNINTIISDRANIQSVDIINPFNLDLETLSDKPLDIWEDNVVFLTSGTSGQLKIINYSGLELSEQIKNASTIVKNNKLITKSFKGYLKHLVILPFYHVFGFIAVFLWFSFFNVTFVLPINLSNKAIQQACILTHPTHIFAVPLFWEKLSNEIDSYAEKMNLSKKLNKAISLSYNIQNHFPLLGNWVARNIIFSTQLRNILGKSIKFCISGGSFIKSETLRKINCIGYYLFNGYGSTETGITSFCFSKEISKRVSGSIGSPFSSIVYNLVPIDKNYELCVSGKSVARSIFTNGHFIDTNYIVNTNDVVRKLKDDFYLIGRSDEIIVGENGENYSIPSLEAQFKFSYASDYLIFYSKEKHYFILLISYSKTVLSAQINSELNALEDKATKLQINEIYYCFNSFPKANEIKIKRNQVIDSFYSTNKNFILFDSSNTDESNSSGINDEVLQKIICLFIEHFNNQNINADSHFYRELGGDSLGYVTLLNNIQLSFNVDIDLTSAIPQTPAEFALVVTRSIG